MSATHLVFAIATTVYILVAIQFEEHDLINDASGVRGLSQPGAYVSAAHEAPTDAAHID